MKLALGREPGRSLFVGRGRVERLRSPDDDGILRLRADDVRVRSISVRVGVDGVDVEDDNVDVEIALASGAVASRTFITPKNTATLLERWNKTGEAGGGAFLSLADTVVIPELTEAAILCAVAAMLNEGDLA